MSQKLNPAWLQEVERSHRKSMRISNKDLIQTFPEAAPLLVEQNKQLKERKQELLKLYYSMRIEVKDSSQDEFTWWFFDQLFEANHLEELKEIEQRLQKNKYLLRALLQSQSQITDEQIERAKQRPIQELITHPVQRTGKNLKSRCPFHEDRTPSFVIYTHNNSAWCFGCGQGGDAIDVVQLIQGCTFPDAIKLLTH